MLIRLLERLRVQKAPPSQASPPVSPLPSVEPLHPKLERNLQILAKRLGQRRTFDAGRPLDAEGRPIPWFTYPAVEYLSRFRISGWEVFEYGCGESTAFWSGHGARVTSVEHDEKWSQELRARALSNVEIHYRPDRATYPRAAAEMGRRFDVVVVDGVWREDCVEHAIAALRPDGILVLDNSDWYADAGAMIRARGFHEVSFSGFGPVNDYTWATSIFFPGKLRIQDKLAPPLPIGGNPIAFDQRGKFW